MPGAHVPAVEVALLVPGRVALVEDEVPERQAQLQQHEPSCEPEAGRHWFGRSLFRPLLSRRPGRALRAVLLYEGDETSGPARREEQNER